MDNLPMINGLTVAITLSGLKLTMANSDEDEDPSMVNSDEDERIEECKELLMLNGTSKEAIETYEKVQSCFDNLPIKYIHKGPKRQKKFLLYNKIVTRPEMKTYEEIQEALNALL